MEAKFSRCASATAVTTAASGTAISVSVRISPGADMPSSTTPTSSSPAAESSESGRPHWLFRLPGERKTRRAAPTAAAAASFAVVLPTLPVIAAISAPLARRRLRASAPSAVVGSSTSMRKAPGEAAPGVRAPPATTAPAAPRASASATKAWPSRCGPRMAKKRSPAAARRLSIETPVISRGSAGAGGRIRPAIAAAASPALRRTEASPSAGRWAVPRAVTTPARRRGCGALPPPPSGRRRRAASRRSAGGSRGPGRR